MVIDVGPGGPHHAPEQGELQLVLRRLSTARLTHFWLGGRSYYAVDERFADSLLTVDPEAPAAARAQRAGLQEAVARLAAVGVRQYLDLGCGIPLVGPAGPELLDVHRAVACTTASSVTVYVDVDPEVALYLDALHDPVGEHRVHSRQADIVDPDLLPGLFRDGCLDAGRPVAALLCAVLPELYDEQVRRLSAVLARELPPGSTLTLGHRARGHDTGSREASAFAGAGIAWHPRTPKQVASLLAEWLPPAPAPLAEDPGPGPWPTTSVDTYCLRTRGRSERTS